MSMDAMKTSRHHFTWLQYVAIMGKYMRVYYLPTPIVMYRVSLHIICT